MAESVETKACDAQERAAVCHAMSVRFADRGDAELATRWQNEAALANTAVTGWLLVWPATLKWRL